MRNDKPVLWQIGISHYSEKLRWALDHKQVDHVRRAPPPGTHIPVALWLTRGEGATFPVLQLDGGVYGDSSAALAALEARFPEPSLYPADPAERERALALEDFFDEELGPHTRLLAFHELISEPQLFAEIAARSVHGPLSRSEGFAGAYARAYTSLRFGTADEQRAAMARAKIVAAFERLEVELETGDGEFLVGDSFGVADLTTASLFYPIVVPTRGLLSPDQPAPPALERFRESLRDRPGFTWVEQTYRRHRHPERAAAARRGD